MSEINLIVRPFRGCLGRCVHHSDPFGIEPADRNSSGILRVCHAFILVLHALIWGLDSSAAPFPTCGAGNGSSGVEP